MLYQAYHLLTPLLTCKWVELISKEWMPVYLWCVHFQLLFGVAALAVYHLQLLLEPYMLRVLLSGEIPISISPRVQCLLLHLGLRLRVSNYIDEREWL